MAHARHSTYVKRFGKSLRTIERFAKSLYILAALLLTAVVASIAAAQSSCDHVTFHLADTAQTIDREAICRAAEPWAGQDIQAFILLTDFSPDGQEAWYDYLDQAEAQVNIRDLSQEDAFNVNVLALEASTVDRDYVYNVTIGETLFDTPLDSEAGRAPIIGALREGVLAGEPTEGFANALSAAYTLNHPATAPGGEAISEEAVSGVTVANVLPLILLIAVLGAAAYYLFPRLLEPVLAKRRQPAVQPELLEDTEKQWLTLDDPLSDQPSAMTQAQLIGAIDAFLARTDKDLEGTITEEE